MKAKTQSKMKFNTGTKQKIDQAGLCPVRLSMLPTGTQIQISNTNPSNQRNILKCPIKPSTQQTTLT